MMLPSQSILKPSFEYRNAASTDITITWRKHGWLPLKEQTVSDDYRKGYAAGYSDGLKQPRMGMPNERA